MKYTQYTAWQNEKTTHTSYNMPIEKIIDIMKNDLNYVTFIGTWLEDENGKVLAYFDKNTQSITGEEEMKKWTKEEVLERINFDIHVHRRDIKDVLDALEEKGYIKFKKEPKKYKVFVKLVTIGEENKKLYYVNEHHLTDNIDEAKRFETYEDKDGYGYEIVKESV